MTRQGKMGLTKRLRNLEENKHIGKMPSCDKKVYRYGEHIATFYDFEAIEAENIVKAASRDSKQKIDWHYFGGRIIVKALGDPNKAREYLTKYLGKQITSCRFTTDDDSVLP